ncbi:MAG: N-formylglutamate amidohydrolase [Alphaproteobacteria bacterium]
MDTLAQHDALGARPIETLVGAGQTAPLVFASPHSGRDYPASFVAGSPLDALTLRRSEDSFVDEIFAAAPDHGAPLLRALFPRAYVDPNREPYELDPSMFEGALPAEANSASPRVAGGLGTIARVVCSGAEIYDRKIGIDEALHRIETLYRPYHAELRRLLAQTKARFGAAVLIDCHSMPSVGGPMDQDPGLKRVDFVLGDAHGASCAPALRDRVEAFLSELGYVVTRNQPYAGGFTTRHYGRPAEGVHALQIEINRALYMNEASYERKPYFETLVQHMSALTASLTRLDPGKLVADGNAA